MVAMSYADMIDALGCDPVKKLCGAKLRSSSVRKNVRTAAQNATHDRLVKALAPRFRTLNPMTAAAPDECISHDMLVRCMDSLGWWIWQSIGSCVGAGDGTADQIALAGDIIIREEREEVKTFFPYATWGFGRRLGGLRGRGDGSFGGAQIEADYRFGLLAIDTPGLPQGTKRDGHWIQWSEDDEYDYSWPPSWPVKESVLAPLAQPQQIIHSALIKTLDELEQAIVQGYGLTQASNWGCERPRIVDGVLMGKRDAVWPHQTWIGGYTKKKGPRKWLFGNNWGPRAHGGCPYLLERWNRYGFSGGVMWIDDANMLSIIREGETFARGTKGFPLRDKIDWGSFRWW